MKTLQADVSNLEVGAAPGWGAAIDTRHDLVDTASSATVYTATPSPAPTGSDTIPAGYYARFTPNTTSGADPTLNVGSSEGAVAIKKYIDGSGTKYGIGPGDLRSDEPVDLRFDGTHWIAYEIRRPLTPANR